MADDDLRDQIEQLEIRIEELAESAERCRKIILFSKAAIAIGGFLMLAITFGPIRFDPRALLGAIAAVIGGIVVFGSNRSTMDRTTVAIQSAETLRDELISRIELRVVDG